jgi:hypothetical protein
LYDTSCHHIVIQKGGGYWCAIFGRSLEKEGLEKLKRCAYCIESEKILETVQQILNPVNTLDEDRDGLYEIP